MTCCYSLLYWWLIYGLLLTIIVLYWLLFGNDNDNVILMSVVLCCIIVKLLFTINDCHLILMLFAIWYYVWKLKLYYWCSNELTEVLCQYYYDILMMNILLYCYYYWWQWYDDNVNLIEEYYCYHWWYWRKYWWWYCYSDDIYSTVLLLLLFDHCYWRYYYYDIDSLLCQWLILNDIMVLVFITVPDSSIVWYCYCNCVLTSIVYYWNWYDKWLCVWYYNIEVLLMHWYCGIYWCIADVFVGMVVIVLVWPRCWWC